MTNPDQIRGEIHRTHRELSADVDALSEKLSPPRVVERRVRRTRAAVTNMKNKIMGSTASGTSSAMDTVSTTASSAADAVTSAPDMVRRGTEGNPLAAGVMAFGAGWLLSSLVPSTSRERQVATQVKDAAADQARPVTQQLGEAVQQAKDQLREPARQAAESVRSSAASGASAVAAEAKAASGDVTGRAQQAKDTVTKQSKPSGT